MNIITVQNLSKQFKIDGPVKQAFVSRFSNILGGVRRNKKIQPLQSISFTVKKGECLGVIGKNGAGKTTLLKTVAGIYKKDSGSVEINGKMLFLASISNGMNSRLTVKDNVYLIGAILGLSKKQIDEIYGTIIEFSGLEEFVNSKIYQLSSGMKQRIAFSTLIHCVEVLNPDVLLLDEVLAGGGGDEEFKDGANKKVQDFLSDGKTMIIVSHSLNNIREHCDRAIWMHQGQIKKEGAPEEIADEYIKYIKELKIAKTKGL